MYTVPPTKSRRSTLAMVVVALGLLLSLVTDLMVASRYGIVCNGDCESLYQETIRILISMVICNGLTLGLTLLLRKRLAPWLALPAILVTVSPLFFTLYLFMAS